MFSQFLTLQLVASMLAPVHRLRYQLVYPSLLVHFWISPIHWIQICGLLSRYLFVAHSLLIFQVRLRTVATTKLIYYQVLIAILLTKLYSVRSLSQASLFFLVGSEFVLSISQIPRLMMRSCLEATSLMPLFYQLAFLSSAFPPQGLTLLLRAPRP